MDFVHHQLSMRDLDGEWICSRCGLVNPPPDQPCLPLNADPAEDGKAREE